MGKRDGARAPVLPDLLNDFGGHLKVDQDEMGGTGSISLVFRGEKLADLSSRKEPDRRFWHFSRSIVRVNFSPEFQCNTAVMTEGTS